VNREVRRPVRVAGGVADLPELLRSAWGVEGDVVLVRALGGLSGARVFIADLVATDFSGQAIL
jgi:hypothetical protein